MRHIGRFVAEGFAGDDDAVWRLLSRLHLRLHVAELHRRGVRTEHISGGILDEERVLHVARGMVFRHVQRIEIVPLVLEKRAGCVRKTHGAEYPCRFAHEDRNRMQMPLPVGRLACLRRQACFGFLAHTKSIPCRSKPLYLVELVLVVHDEPAAHDSHVGAAVRVDRHDELRRPDVGIDKENASTSRRVDDSVAEENC